MDFRKILTALALPSSVWLLSACGDCSQTDVDTRNTQTTLTVRKTEGIQKNTKEINDCLQQPDPNRRPATPAGPPCGCGCT